MNEKYYDDYRSFGYLKAGIDYRLYELSDDLNHSYITKLNEEDEEEVSTILSEKMIVSMRDHGFIVPKHFEDIIPYCQDLHTSFHYEGIAKSGIDVIFENFMDGIAITTSKNGLKWDEVIYLLGMRYADIAHQESVYIAKTYKDLTSAKKNKQTALLPSLEAANVLENEVDRVDILYGLGIRCMGITYNEANTLGAGLIENNGGLTNFGRRVIERMNHLGMIIDISHCNESTSLDVIHYSEMPVLITHAGAKSLWNTARMKSDKVLQSCAEKGGVIGICAAPNTTVTHERPVHSIESVMEHFEYIASLVGIDHVGFGPDTFFGDHVALQHAFDDRLGISASHKGEMVKEAKYVQGAENPSEAMKNMVRWLVKHEYKEIEIEKAAGQNVMRVIKNILK
ncbi:membrane dipeptidase [Virgibacillus halotolerans]|uniref:dipeptidase n=1 Tax=Virgibacillus halotolerans TaxID=1071053 RepID=UPI0019613F3F|nr:membrane dipeptidase [Virgibacillus halotolerans]MBM7599223.1 membrane dipeptidase [Virgibacillus halotolerans]